MTTNAGSGDPNITKPLKIDNKTHRARTRLILALAAGLAVGLAAGLMAPAALAIPVTIAWEVPLSQDETYKLEVASDPGFAHVVTTADVKGTAFFWDAPGEGVYHWRLTRPEQAAKGGEGNTFVSGTFTVIDARVKRDKSARLTWKPIPGADHYKIYMLDANEKEHTMITSAPFFVVSQTDASLMIEVVPFTEGHKTERDFHYDPSLALDTGNPPVAPPPPPPPPPTTVEVQQPVAAAPTGAPPPPEPPRRRVHVVYLFGTGEQERLRTQKLDVDIDSSGTYYGGGAGLWLNPLAGLVLSGQGDYHEHQDHNATQPSVFPGMKIPVLQSRYTADIEIGYNVLDFFDVHSQILTLSAAAAVTQLPFLPTVFDSTAGVVPSFTKKQLTLPGGAASYGYLGSWGAVVIEGGILDDQASDQAKLQFQRLLVEFYPAEHFAIELGAFNRFEQGSTCAPDSASCLAEGTVRTTAEERGGWLGVGTVFK